MVLPAHPFVGKDTGQCIKNSGFKTDLLMCFVMLIREAKKELLLEGSAASAWQAEGHGL